LVRHRFLLFAAEPETSLQDGLARMAGWARSAGSRKSKAFDEIEISKGLPPVWR